MLRRALALLGGLALVFAMGLWVRSLSTYRLEPDYGGTYTEGLVGNPKTLNPLFAHFNDTDKDLTYLIYSSLVQLNERGQPIPDLAKRWEISADGLTYTFYLRDDVKWHDGTPFTAADVVATVEAIQHPDFPGSLDFAALWQKVAAEKMGEFTVRFTLDKSFDPRASFLTYNGTIGILPATQLTRTPVKELLAMASKQALIGTGPFKLTDVTLDRAILEANPDYYGGKPYLSSLILEFFPDYPTALNALKEKRIQGLLLRPSEADPGTLTQLEKAKKYRVLDLLCPIYTFVSLDLRSPLFKDKELRQALLYALNRSQVLTAGARGKGVVAEGPIPPETWAYESKTRKYDLNLEKARGLLAQAGWYPGADGVLEKDGVKFRFSLYTNDDPYRIRIGEELVRQWRALGVKVDFAASGYAGLLRDRLVPHQFDAVILGIDAGYDPDPFKVWHSSQAKEDGLNFGSYASKEADALMERACRTTDPKERIELYRQFQSLFAEEVPGLILYYPTYSYLLDDAVQGVKAGVLFEPSSRFLNITQWYVKTKKVK